MAASRTVTDRVPHSMHMYFLRAGDARRPVDFEVTALHDGGTFSARRVTARQFGSVLLEGVDHSVSLSKTLSISSFHRISRIPNPCRASPSNTAITRTKPVAGGCASSRSSTGMSIRLQVRADMAEACPQASECGGAQRDCANDPVIASCLAAFVAGRTLLESAMIARRTTPLGPGFSALMDLAVWFHHPPDLSDWLLYEQHSPSGTGGRGWHRALCSTTPATGVHHDTGVLLRRKERLAGSHRPRLAQGDRQRGPPVQHPGVPAAARAGERTSGKRSKNVRNPTSPSARARAAPRQKCRPPENARCLPALSRRRRTVRIGEHGGVAVGPGEVEDDELALRSGARDLGVDQRDPRSQLHGRLQPQDLLDGVGPQLGPLAEVRSCSGLSSSMRIPLPSRFTVVSKPAASTRPATARARHDRDTFPASHFRPWG